MVILGFIIYRSFLLLVVLSWNIVEICRLIYFEGLFELLVVEILFSVFGVYIIKERIFFFSWNY